MSWKAHADEINYDVAKAREKEVRHDVMSHVYAYGTQCPKARASSIWELPPAMVGDNTDVIIMTEALKLVRRKLLNVLAELAAFADKYKNLPTLAFYPFPAGSAYYCRKKGSPLDDGVKAGSGRSGLSYRIHAPVGLKGNYRHTGQFSGTL